MKQKYIVELITGSVLKVSHMTMYRKGNPAELLSQLPSILITGGIQSRIIELLEQY